MGHNKDRSASSVHTLNVLGILNEVSAVISVHGVGRKSPKVFVAI